MSSKTIPNKEWKMHRILLKQMFKYYNNWYSSNGEKRKKAEQELFRNIALQCNYPNVPRA